MSAFPPVAATGGPLRNVRIRGLGPPRTRFGYGAGAHPRGRGWTRLPRSVSEQRRKPLDLPLFYSKLAGKRAVNRNLAGRGIFSGSAGPTTCPGEPWAVRPRVRARYPGPHGPRLAGYALTPAIPRPPGTAPPR